MRKNKLSFIALSITGILSTFYINASENIIIDNNKKEILPLKLKMVLNILRLKKRMKMVFLIIIIKSLMSVKMALLFKIQRI